MKIKNFEVGWLDILIIILLILAFYLLGTRIFGHSATEVQIIISLFSVIFIIGFKIHNSLQRQILINLTEN